MAFPADQIIPNYEAHLLRLRSIYASARQEIHILERQRRAQEEKKREHFSILKIEEDFRRSAGQGTTPEREHVLAQPVDELLVGHRRQHVTHTSPSRSQKYLFFLISFLFFFL